jgi:F-box and leucine-rich repeat protein GRR1
LTHLSLTGVQAFLHEELTAFCRPAPQEFNDHQRDVFCVFSNAGVNRLREYLNEQASTHPYDGEGTMYDDSEIEAHASNHPHGNHGNVWILQQHMAHAQTGNPTPAQLAQMQLPQLHTLLPPPPPPVPQIHQSPFSQHPQQQNLPPLQIPPPQALGGEGSPNAMSPTNDAPLTLDDDDNFGDGSEMLMDPRSEP